MSEIEVLNSRKKSNNILFDAALTILSSGTDMECTMSYRDGILCLNTEEGKIEYDPISFDIDHLIKMVSVLYPTTEDKQSNIMECISRMTAYSKMGNTKDISIAFALILSLMDSSGIKSEDIKYHIKLDKGLMK